MKAPAPSLRPYQKENVAQLVSILKEKGRRVLYQLPVGGGKTITLASVIHQAKSLGQRVLFIAHRRELIWQAQEKLRRYGLEPRILMGDTRVPLADKDVTIGTIQSLKSPRRLRELGEQDLIVIDEAHHATAPSYLRLLELYPDVNLIGMTATPVRNDGRGLGHLFTEIVQGPTVPSLIEMSYLVEPKYYAPHKPDLRGVRIQNGDYRPSDLDLVMNKPKLVGDIYEWWYRLARERQTLIFASGVKHSIYIASLFQQQGVQAGHVDGSTPVEERDRLFQKFREGEIRVLSNCDVATEGTDLPEVGAVVIARPTKSLVRWVQMVGRGLRTAQGKQDCLVIDHSGTVFTLGFIEDWNTWKLDARYNPRSTIGTATSRKTICCPSCKQVFNREELVHSSAGIFCPVCASRMGLRRTGREVEVQPGDLARITRRGQIASLVDKRNYYAQLLYIQNKRGYKPGWVAHRFRVRFGEWPPYGWQYQVQPQQPTYLPA